MRVRWIGQGRALFVLTFAVFLVSPVRGFTDARYSTLVSEALLRHGTFALDPWFPDHAHLPYQVEAVGGHVYSWYPPGGPLLATPLVGALALTGLSAAGHGGEYDPGADLVVQAIVAAFAMALLSVLFLEIACAFLPPRWSWIVALGGALGTQVWSTASRVMWGDTFLLLILGVVVWRLVLHETGKRPLSAPVLATLLAWAYFTRPTASLAIVAVTIYMARFHRRLILPFVATGGVWLAGFLAWSRLVFGTWLPTYYRIRPFRLASFAHGLLGILVSPSRGEFVFIPVTVYVVYLVVRHARALSASPLLWPALIAVLGHVAMFAAFPDWHAGHSYGPRYLTPLVPWLVLLASIGLRASLERQGRGRRWERSFAALALALSVVIQARGTWVRETWLWNAEPESVTLHPERVWSWRGSQLLAGLLPVPAPPVFPVRSSDHRVDVTSPEAAPFLLSGWSGIEDGIRWTDGRSAELVFALPRIEPLVLEMELEGFLPPGRVREQRIAIELNGHRLETVHLDRGGARVIAVSLPAATLAGDNRLRFTLPDATFASRFGLGSDSRQLGVAVRWFALRRAAGEGDPGAAPARGPG